MSEFSIGFVDYHLWALGTKCKLPKCGDFFQLILVDCRHLGEKILCQKYEVGISSHTRGWGGGESLDSNR